MYNFLSKIKMFGLFAVVFFYSDESIDAVNKKRFTSEQESTGSIGDKVLIGYEVEDINESGRDIRKQEDFKGLILAWENGK